MGITPAMLRLLARHCRANAVSGAVLTLGNQDVWGDETDVRRILDEERLSVGTYTPRPTTTATLRQRSKLGYLHARTLFEMLGFTDYADLDKFDQDDPLLRVDLNEPLPADLRSRFDLVLDLGTTEHIFNVPAVLRSVGEAARVGGWVIHSLPIPSLYWAQHGYYCFNPDLLLDYYRMNDFTIEACKVLYYKRPLFGTLGPESYSRDALMFDYRPGMALRHLVPYDAMTTFWIAVRKNREAGAVVPPNQQKEKAAAPGPDAPAPALLKRLFFTLEPLLGALSRAIYRSRHRVQLSRI